MGASCIAQVINIPLQDNKAAKLLLRNVQIIDSEKYSDFSFANQKYFLEVEFGRKTFEVGVFNGETGERISLDMVLIGDSFFTKVKAANQHEEYQLTQNGINYNVIFREVIPSRRLNERTITVFIQVRDTINKKYLYMANDTMYLPN